MTSQAKPFLTVCHFRTEWQMAVCMPRTSRSNRLSIYSNSSGYPFKTVIIISCRFHFDCSRIGRSLVLNSYNIVPTVSCAKNRPKHHHCGTTRDSNLFTSLQGGRVIVFWSCSKKIALHVHKAITHQQNVSRSVSLTIQRQNSWFLVSFTGSCSTCSQSPVKEKYHSNMKGHKRNPYFQLSITIVPAMYYLIRESYLLSWVYTTMMPTNVLSFDAYRSDVSFSHGHEDKNSRCSQVNILI